MKITLLHKTDAGDAKHSKEILLELLESHGHKVYYSPVGEEPIRKVLKQPADLVIAAGGDGTVRKIALKMAGTDIPLAVFPLGTANNLAKELIDLCPIETIAASLSESIIRKIDCGIVRTPWGDKRFLEGAGLGLMGAYFKASQLPGPAEAELLLKLVDSSLPFPIHPDEGSEALPWTCFLLQFMNNRRLGPGWIFAPNAQMDDGFLDLIAIGDGERHEMRHFCEELRAGKGVELGLNSKRCVSRKLRVANCVLNVDDHVYDEPLTSNFVELEFAVEKAVIKFLVPPPGRS